MRTQTALVAVIALASHATALSTSCTTAAAALALGDLGSCLQFTTLLPLLTASGSIVDSLDSYLSSLCGSSTPTCSNDTLTSAESSITSGCSSDLSDGGTDATEVEALLSVLQYYDEFQAAACSTNSTNGDYCITETLTTIQDTTGTNVTISSLTSFSSLNMSTSGLCTECVSGIYYEVIQANASLADSTFGETVTSTCGSDFGTSAPNTTTTTSSTSSTSSSTTSSSSSLGFTSAPYSSIMATAGIASSVIGAVFFGTTMVL